MRQAGDRGICRAPSALEASKVPEPLQEPKAHSGKQDICHSSNDTRSALRCPVYARPLGIHPEFTHLTLEYSMPRTPQGKNSSWSAMFRLETMSDLSWLYQGRLLSPRN